MGKVIMGSTDIRVDDPDEAHCDEDEISYMFETLRDVFPGLKVSRGEVVYKFCGVRPLPASSGDFTGKTSRDHSIEMTEPDDDRTFPVLSLIGGKLTTFRAFAEQTADVIMPRIGIERQTSTEHIPIGGGKDFPSDEAERERWIQRVAEKTGHPNERIAALLERYGTFAEEYAAGIAPDAETPLKSHPGYTVGEIDRIVADEYVEHLTDLICRRSLIAILGEASEAVLEELASIAAARLGWDQPRKDEEVRLALEEVAV